MAASRSKSQSESEDLGTAYPRGDAQPAEPLDSDCSARRYDGAPVLFTIDARRAFPTDRRQSQRSEHNRIVRFDLLHGVPELPPMGWLLPEYLYLQAKR